MIVTFNKAIEEPVFSGSVETFEQLTGNAFSLMLGSFNIQADIVSEKQQWLGMKNSQNGIKYIYRLEKTIPEFSDRIRIIEPLALSDIASKCPITINNPSTDNTTKVFVNFEGRVLDFIDWYANILGKFWVMNVDGTISLIDIPTAGTLSLPIQSLTAELEVSKSRGLNGFNGVKYNVYSETSTPDYYQLVMEKPKFRIVIEPPFTDASDNLQYVIVYAEYLFDINYADIDIGVTPLVNFVYGAGATKGLTTSQNKDVYEYDWTWDGNTRFMFYFRVAVPYPNSGDINKAILDAFMNKLGVDDNPAFSHTQFQITFNRKKKVGVENTVGSAPFREISVAGIPRGLESNYADKMHFYYCYTQRLIYTQVFKTDYNGLVDIGSSGSSLIKAVNLTHDTVEDYATQTVEVVSL